LFAYLRWKINLNGLDTNVLRARHGGEGQMFSMGEVLELEFRSLEGKKCREEQLIVRMLESR